MISVEDIVIIELKTVDEFNPVHEAQILNLYEVFRKINWTAINF